MVTITSPRKELFFSVALIVLLVLAGCGGCINKILPKESESATADDLEGGSEAVSPESPDDGYTSPAVVSRNYQPVAEMTPVKSEIVTEVAPYMTPDPYPILHGTRINETAQFRFLDREPEFEKVYTFRGNATGLLVNVVEGPLFIVYTVTPQNDCMANPESCRGDLGKPVQRPYLTITVRENETREIVAEDGYGREYSSDIGKYTFSITTTDSEDGDGEITIESGPRHIVIYREGVFHITMEGNYLDVDLSIITGSSPDPLEVSTEKQSGDTLPVQSQSPEEEEWE